MNIRFPFRNLMPTFFSGLLDDPILLVHIRPSGLNLMFDCGQIHHLAKRVFTHLDVLFISHAHMDHWMGIDSVIRHVIAAGKIIDIFGPPGIADKFEYKLAGYDWNLAEDYWSSFRVHDVYPDQIRCDLFPGPEGFCRRPLETCSRNDSVIYQNRHLQVLAETCDHRVDSLIFRINECPAYLIDDVKLEQAGLVPGPWLGDLKRYFLQNRKPPSVLSVLKKEQGKIRQVVIEDVAGLVKQLVKLQIPSAIGYISDVGPTERNKEKILNFMQGVDLLLCECTFLRDGKDRARASSHLCTEDVNQLLEGLRPKFFLPMHLSKTYSRQSHNLYRELNPPPGTSLLQIPLQLTPRPLLASEIGWRIYT